MTDLWRFTSEWPTINTGGTKSSDFLMRDLSIAIQTPTNGGDDVGHVPGRFRTAVGALRVASASPAAIHDGDPNFLGRVLH